MGSNIKGSKIVMEYFLTDMNLKTTRMCFSKKRWEYKEEKVLRRIEIGEMN